MVRGLIANQLQSNLLGVRITYYPQAIRWGIDKWLSHRPDKTTCTGSNPVIPTSPAGRSTTERGTTMPNVQAIPAGKQDHVSNAEKEEFDSYRKGEDNLYEAGILDVPNAYDPNAGSKYTKNSRPVVAPGPLLATDPGQPDNISANVTGRQPAVDKPEGRVVRSRGKGK